MLISHLKLIERVGGKRWLVALNLVVLSTVFVALLYYQWEDEPTALLGTIAVVAGAFVVELVFRYLRRREFGKERAGAARGGAS